MKDFAESRLALGSGELWNLGTHAEFLDAVGDGSLPEDVFNRWLVQDYLFVRGFASFASLTVAKTPRPEQSVLIAGLSALDDELGWFEGHAQARSLDLGADLHPACQRYTDFLITAGYSEPFQVLLAIFYGVEVAYAVAWGALEAQGPYAEFVNRWSRHDLADFSRPCGSKQEISVSARGWGRSWRQGIIPRIPIGNGPRPTRARSSRPWRASSSRCSISWQMTHVRSVSPTVMPCDASLTSSPPP